MDVGGLRQRKPEPIDKLVTEAGMDVSGAGTCPFCRRPMLRSPSDLTVSMVTNHQARSTRRGIAGFLRCPVVPQEVASQTRRSDEIQLEPSR